MDTKNRLSRRDFLRVSGIATAGLALAACAPIAAPSPQTGALAAEGAQVQTAQEVPEVRWWSRGSPEWQEAMQAITDAYLEVHPDRTVVLEIMPSERYDDKVFTSAAAGTIADIFHANSEMVVTFASKGIVMDVTPLLDADTEVKKDDWYDWAWVRAIYHGGLYAMPQKGNAVLTFYNKTLFDDAGVAYPEKGWTWDDFVSTAAQLTDPDTNQWGAWTFPWHVAVWENLGDIITEDGQTCVLDQPAAYEAIQWVADLGLVKKVSPKVEEQAMFGSMNPFMSGKVATYVEGESNVGRFIQNVDTFDWGAAWVPKGKEVFSEGTATMFCMDSKTDVVDPAWGFLKFLAADMKAYEALNAAGKLGIPPHKEALQKLFIGTEPRPDVKEILADMAEVNRVWMQNVTAGAEVKTAVDQGLSRVWSGDQSAADACATLTLQVNEILAQQPG